MIDGLFDDGLVGVCNAWLDRVPYHRADYDNENSEQFPHFMLELEQSIIDQQPVLRLLDRVVRREVDAAYGDLEPELMRAHVNLAPYGDHFFPHVDSEKGVTAIFYANREWRDEWQGETLFYAGGEPTVAVAPRPGRLVLLPGDLVHRVGGPSRLFSGARLTIAFKFATRSAPQ